LQLVPQLYTPVVDTPILDPLVEKFIDAFAPDGHDDCGKSSAIRRAGSERMFSPLLNEAFQAVSVAYFAQSIGSRAAVAHSYRGYCRVLHHLQKALIDPSQSRSSGVFATVILLMAYEVRSASCCSQNMVLNPQHRVFKTLQKVLLSSTVLEPYSSSSFGTPGITCLGSSIYVLQNFSRTGYVI
jgi:hypothetical protein